MRYADSHAGADDRLERVVRSFQGLAAAVPQVRFPGVRKSVRCEVTELDRGVRVSLRTEDDAAEVVMSVEPEGVTLRASSRARPGADRVTVIDDELSVRLEQELRWGDAVFRSPDVLACRLLEHAALRLAIVSDDGWGLVRAVPAMGRRVLPLPGSPGDPYGWTRGVPSMRTTTPLRPPRMRDG
jgi:hypothetical protein